MTHIVEKPTVKDTSVERTLVTIEFYCRHKIDHSKFTFCERVIITNHFPEKVYTVCGIEICISETPSGELISPPRWKYKVTDADKNSFWKEETALIRYKDTSYPNTCSSCDRFQDFHEHNGRGWCQQFNCSTKAHHQMTNDCVLSGALKEYPEAFPTQEIVDEADLPHSQFQVGNIVKVIDPVEHHSEWATFVIIGRQYNHERSALEYETSYSKRDLLYRSTEAYLSETAWYYWLINPSYESTYDERLWVAEDQICLFDQSHLICTEDIF